MGRDLNSTNTHSSYRRSIELLNIVFNRRHTMDLTVTEPSKTAVPLDAERQRQAQSGVELSKHELKSLYRRSDAKGLLYFGGWVFLCVASGFLYYLNLHTLWMVPTLMLYGTLLALGYAMSHETTHGTAFRTRWLNETVFWFTSLVYGHEPYHRRYSHASHHTYTEMRGVDAQKPWDHPMTLWDYLKKLSGFGEVTGFSTILLPHALGLVPDGVKRYTPESEQPNLIWGARAFIAIHLAFHWCFCVYGSLVGTVCVFSTFQEWWAGRSPTTSSISPSTPR